MATRRSLLSRLRLLHTHSATTAAASSGGGGGGGGGGGYPCRVFVGGLSGQVDEELLKDAFASFGQVLDARIIMDRETGRSKGFGFVSFASNKDADAAIKVMDGRDLNGKVLRVNFAVDNRPSGYGNYGG